MGSTVSDLWSKIFGKKEMRILMVGLDNAGKTTILYKLKLGEILSTMPTIGFNVESVEYKNMKLTVWDIGGQDRIRALWKHYYSGTNAIIFVVDSSDVARYEIAYQELSKLLDNYELRELPLLIFANKQDLCSPSNPVIVARALHLTSVKERAWFCQPCVASDGYGIYDGLEWLTTQLER